MAHRPSAIELLERQERFSTFTELLRRSGAWQSLQGEQRHFTIFAPADQAFAALRDKTRAELDQNLRRAVERHIVNGEVSVRNQSSRSTKVDPSRPLVVRWLWRASHGLTGRQGQPLSVTNRAGTALRMEIGTAQVWIENASLVLNSPSVLGTPAQGFIHEITHVLALL